MIAFILARILQAVPVLLAVALIAFAIFKFAGDPVLEMLGQNYTDADLVAMRQKLGLDQPIIVQYMKFVAAALQGQFGTSYRLARPVATLIAERLPATLELAVAASLLAVAVGVPLGAFTAIRPRSLAARAAMALSLFGVSLPTFLIGILLILFFSVELGWLPSFGRGDVVAVGTWWTTGLATRSGLRALILPSVTLSLFQMTLIMRLVRAEMLEALRSDCVRFARARGLPERIINFRHALRNALVPVITIVGLQLGGLIAFSLVTETVFQWPGLGLLFVQSVQAGDIPVMSAYMLLAAVVFVSINLIVDLLCHAVDPRLRVRADGGAR